MTGREQFDMAVGIYVAALGQGKPQIMIRDVFKSAFAVDFTTYVGDPDRTPQRAAYDFVSWKLGLDSRPEWLPR